MARLTRPELISIAALAVAVSNTYYAHDWVVRGEAIKLAQVVLGQGHAWPASNSGPAAGGRRTAMVDAGGGTGAVDTGQGAGVVQTNVSAGMVQTNRTAGPVNTVLGTGGGNTVLGTGGGNTDLGRGHRRS